MLSAIFPSGINLIQRNIFIRKLITSSLPNATILLKMGNHFHNFHLNKSKIICRGLLNGFPKFSGFQIHIRHDDFENIHTISLPTS